MELLSRRRVKRGGNLDSDPMHKFVISAAIISLIGGTSLAIAQDHGRDGGQHGSSGERHEGGPAQHAGGPAGGAPRPAPQAAPQAARQAAPNPATASGRKSIGERQFREHHDVPSPARNDNGRDRRDDNNARNNNSFRGNQVPGQNFNRPDFNRPGGPNNAMRDNRGQRHDFSSAPNFHQNFRAVQRFHAPAYRRPQGYYDRRWRWGQTLPVAFWARDYWLDDFSAYDLPPPPYGAVWVRVGDDALLIDQDSGEIIEIEYGVFY
jgi:Ni/Co efflux regulator RcnB